MKIFSNYSYKVNFGYDKQLNKEFKENLASYPDKRWAQTISSMNSSCNKLESNLKHEEKIKNGKESKYEDYLDLFLTQKQMLAGFVEITFENLNFANREYKHYDDEFIKHGSQEEDWRKDVCDYLTEWTTFDNPKELKNTSSSDNLYSPKFDGQGEEVITSNQIPPPLEKVSSVISQLSSKSFLEEFKKDESSPSGFSDVAGMSDLKRDLNEGIIEYIQNPEQAKLDYEEYGKTIPKGILLYGPPGCGKTYITQALASEISSPMYLLNISKAGSHYINLTSKNLKAAFDEAIQIAEKNNKPCILFMDEIDSLGFDRNSQMEPDDLKQVSTMLQSIDEAKKSNVIIIGATNKYNLLDSAIRRRFDSKVFVDVPDSESIKDLLKKNLMPLSKGQKLLASNEDIELIANNLQGYSNNSVCNISKAAALNAMRRNRADISAADYLKAIETTTEEKPDRKIYMADSTTVKKNKIGFN
ncbi:MAG: ATP-binding protein [Candidatus Gastranaerophilales bacterium]|nr:ATP-binding protein [Candidatus Gastranaerophilales bacterium]